MNLLLDDSVRQAYTPDWRASDTLLVRLDQLLRQWRPRSIVETGPGLSSILFYRYAQSRPGTHYVSLDHEGTFHERFVAHARSLGFDTGNAHAVPLADDQFYARCPLPQRTYDLIVLDGPASSESRALPRSLELIRGWMHPRSILVQDDTHRVPERSVVDTIERWFPGGHFQCLDVQDPHYPRRSTILLPATSPWARMKRVLGSFRKAT